MQEEEQEEEDEWELEDLSPLCLNVSVPTPMRCASNERDLMAKYGAAFDALLDGPVDSQTEEKPLQAETPLQEAPEL